ncbi:MAG: GNAT family N-acetyltransferase [Inhella sp.]
MFSDPPETLVAELLAGVRAHNAAHLGAETSRPLAVEVRDAQGRLLGGLSGRTIYRQFLIDLLWVAEDARGQGLGRQLMAAAEAEARQRGCVAAQLDTLDFQAPHFYAKLGFETVGRVSGIPANPERFFLLKRYA